jgi:isoleucyl-tRNA synthetase
MEKDGHYSIQAGDQDINLTLEDVEITSQDIPGWLVTTDGEITVALDITITKDLRQEGIARELINRIQNLRKDKNFEVTDKIKIRIKSHQEINEAVEKHKGHIGSQTLAEEVAVVEDLNGEGDPVEISEEIKTEIQIEKIK